MNRGVARRNVFDTARHGECFVELLAEAVTASPLELHAYCLMPNHFHLLVRGRPADLSAVMQLVGTNYSRFYNRSTGRDGPLFRSRFHCKPIGTNQYVAAVSRYIHRNPLERMRGAPLENYRWSSFRYYVGKAPVPAFVVTAPTLDEFGGAEAYADFVRRDCLQANDIDVDWLIATAIEIADLPSRLNTNGLDRSVAVALLETANEQAAARLREWIGCAPGHEPVLRAQATARLHKHPEFIDAVLYAEQMIDEAA